LSGGAGGAGALEAAACFEVSVISIFRDAELSSAKRFSNKRRSQGLATYAELNSKIAITGVKFVPQMLIRWIFRHACPL